VITRARQGPAMPASGAPAVSGSNSHIQLQIRWLEALVIGELLDCWLGFCAARADGGTVSSRQGEHAGSIRKASVKATPMKDGYPLREKRFGFASALLLRACDDRAR
jgi:hypothetical protein